MNPSNARHLRLTAAAGTELAVASSNHTVILLHCLWIRDSSDLTAVYDPKAFIPHAASHSQGFPHWKISSTAASRRSLGSVSVPVWLTTLSGQLSVLALVSFYLTNKLMEHGAILKCQALRSPAFPASSIEVAGICGISNPFGMLSPAQGKVLHVLLTRSPLSVHHSPLRSTCMPKPRRQRSL
jgi:hypothetical protein